MPSHFSRNARTKAEWMEFVLLQVQDSKDSQRSGKDAVEGLDHFNLQGMTQSKPVGQCSLGWPVCLQ